MELTAREVIQAAYEFYMQLETTLPPDIPFAYRRQIARNGAALAGLMALDDTDSMSIDIAKAIVVESDNAGIPLSWKDILFAARSQLRQEATDALAARIVLRPSDLWDSYFSDRYTKLTRKVNLITRMIDEEEEDA